MTWTLEIHHLDVVGSGDATLIVARDDGVGHAHGPSMRTCLVDGGRATAGPTVHGYLTTTANLGTGPGQHPLDIIVVTHYDADHMNGVRNLLQRRGAGIYDHTLVFDQGEPAGDENSYFLYADAIGVRPGRVRVTRNVANVQPPVKERKGKLLRPGPVNNVRIQPRTFLTHGAVPNNPAVNAPPPLVVPGAAVINPANLAEWWHPYWLVGREILWTGTGGEPINQPRPHAPTMTCIAANRFVREDAGHSLYRAVAPLGNPEKIKNEMSLAFELRFGTFRYYIGGDIEEAQERTIAEYLNDQNSVAGRVHVVKASHHGADTASTRSFIRRMRPEAVIISCSTSNQYGHPAPRTAAILDGYPDAATPPPPQFRPIPNYLTGYEFPHAPGGPNHGGGASSEIAGDPVPLVGAVQRGHVRLDVTQAQSQYDARGLLATTLVTGADRTANVLGLAPPGGLLPALAKAVLSVGPPVARITAVVQAALGVAPGFGAAPATIAATVTAGTAPGTIAGGMPAIVAAVHAAAIGAAAPVPAAQAAVVAVAAGLAGSLGGVVHAAVLQLVQQATHAAALLGGAGAGAAAAAGVAAAAATNAATPAAGRFTVTCWIRYLAVPGAHTQTIY
ncbi:ComEC/Rec2 family competence protein [Dactylosporangium sp. CS-033363]|uniref:ComEC/Rec2 family competence protein n=1 Tax=Dactylosporangium sp. CS-033363 TaxID=3239935 RepID=UPI003D8A6C16